jgi:hypothetical protein
MKNAAKQKRVDISSGDCEKEQLIRINPNNQHYKAYNGQTEDLNSDINTDGR